MSKDLPEAWTDPEPTDDGRTIALPGPHPHTSADVGDWAGRAAEREGHGIPEGGQAAATSDTGTSRALPGPHPHESADFKEWAGHDGTGNRTEPGRPGDPLGGDTEPQGEAEPGTV